MLTAKEANKIYKQSKDRIFQIIEETAKNKKTEIKLYERYQGYFYQKLFKNIPDENTIELKKNTEYNNISVVFNNESFVVSLNQLIDLGYKITFVNKFNIFLIISWNI